MWRIVLSLLVLLGSVLSSEAQNVKLAWDYTPKPIPASVQGWHVYRCTIPTGTQTCTPPNSPLTALLPVTPMAMVDMSIEPDTGYCWTVYTAMKGNVQVGPAKTAEGGAAQICQQRQTPTTPPAPTNLRVMNPASREVPEGPMHYGVPLVGPEEWPPSQQ